MKVIIFGILVVFFLVQTEGWKDGLWGRELNKQKPAENDEARKLAEEIIQHHYKGKASQITKMNPNSKFRKRESYIQ